MDITGRTLLRLFLLVGGIVVASVGYVNGETLHLGIGIVAAILGAFGLWYELTHDAAA